MSDLAARNFNRLRNALASLEHAKDGGKCAVCGARTYRDAAVLLREGCWIAPASFHESDCLLAKAMRDIEQLSIPEEKEDERKWLKEYWSQPQNAAILDRARRVLAETSVKIEESEVAKFN